MTGKSELPRVTYSNISADFNPLHDWLDEAIPKFKDRLGGEWPNVIAGRADTGGETYEVFSPIDGELLIGRFVAADAAAVGRAVEAARGAFPAWSGMPWEERVAAMRRFAAKLDERKYDLGMAALFEVGKSRLEAIGEAEEAVDLINYYCDEMERQGGFQRPMERAVEREETMCVLRPVGVFAVIAPFNFPVALVCNMVGGCLVTFFRPMPSAPKAPAANVQGPGG